MKRFVILAAALLVMSGCMKEDNFSPVREGRIFHGSVEARTKASMQNDGAFSWTANDQIRVFSSSDSQLYKATSTAASSDFTAVGTDLSGDATYAVYPANIADGSAISGNILTVTLPSSYEVSNIIDMESSMAMLAKASGDNLPFRHMAGILRVNLGQVAAGVKKFVVETPENIAGVTTADLTEDYPVIDVPASPSKTITITLTSALGVNTDDCVVMVPLPVNHYTDLTVKMYNASDVEVGRFVYGDGFDIVRRSMARLGKFNVSEITTVEVNPSENEVTLPAGITAGVALDFSAINNDAAKTITVKYASDAAADKPAKVFITSGATTGNISLAGNLPASTVDILAGTYATTSFTTAPGTLHIREDVTLSGVTINGGNAEIEGKVENVTVAEGAKADVSAAGASPVQVNLTGTAAVQQVTINAATDIVVEQPKDNIDVDATEKKVQVIVNAEGSSATARNGGAIYVEANVDCVVNAEGSDETGTENSVVTVASVAEGKTVEATNSDGGQVENNTGDDGKVKFYVCEVGEQKYCSLAEAVAAAGSGATIHLIDDDHVSLTSGGEIEIKKPLTITGAVDEYGAPLYTVYGTPTYSGSYNDVFLNSETGTITISNIAFKEFSNEVVTSYNGRAVLFVGSKNNNAVIDNVYIEVINTEAIHINGGTFSITKCAIDCDNFNDGAFTRGVCVVNDASGSVSNTAISNIVSGNSDVWTAAVEIQSSGAVEISGCELSGDENGYTMGIAAGSAQGLTPGSATVTVSDCSVSARAALFGDGDSGALVSVLSGEYEGALVQGDNGQGLSISGGTFNNDPSDFLADGYVAVEGDGVWTVVEAASTAWDGNSVSEPALNGATYQITTGAELAWVAAQLYAKAENFEGKTVKLMADIDLDGHEWITANGSNYVMRSSANLVEDNAWAFHGTFDGNNKTISGLKISVALAGSQALGFFGGLYGASFKDVTFDEVEIAISTAQQVGTVCGLNYNSTIDNVTVKGSISGYQAVGGIAGRILQVGTISNCINNADVHGSGYNVGGITGIGYLDSAEPSSGKANTRIESCTNNGAIISDDTDAGGIAGLFYGDIKGCTNNGSVSCAKLVGGIVAESRSGSVRNCTNTGVITATTDAQGSYGAGGIVGWIRYNQAVTYATFVTVDGCTNTADIISSGDVAGGIVGTVYVSANVTNNTSSANKVTATKFAAGIVGNFQKYNDDITKTICGVQYSEEDFAALKLTLTGNRVYTPVTITANCTGDFVYDNTSGASCDSSENTIVER